jgi:hypothetical protein
MKRGCTLTGYCAGFVSIGKNNGGGERDVLPEYGVECNCCCRDLRGVSIIAGAGEGLERTGERLLIEVDQRRVTS